MLEEKIFSDYKEAMKQKDAVKSSVLSFLRAQFKTAAIDKKKDLLEDDEAVAIIRKQIKQRQDSIEQFTKGARLDLAEKETTELEILKLYVPQELSEDQLQSVIEETVQALGASGPRDMGKVMKEVMQKLAGRADAKTVSDLVKKRLSG